jgi:uncharacterized damage-inducible protein DinB
MKTKELLLEEMKSCFTSKNWFVSILQSLEGLTADQAEWTNHASDHSIKQIVIHIIFWNERYLKKFLEKEINNSEVDNDITFTEESLDKNTLEWNEILLKLSKINSEWITELTKTDEKKFESENQKNNWAKIISNINIHTAYHTGQIVILRKLQGSWQSSIGVK